LLLVIGITAIDTAVVLWSPAFARPAASLAIVIAWLAVVVVAYCFGMWAGVFAAFLAAGFDAAILRTVQVETSTPLILTVMLVQGIVAAVIGRLRELARRVKEQSGTLNYRERRFQALTEHASDLIVVLGRDGRTTFASSSHLAVLGYEPEAVLAGALLPNLDKASLRRLRLLIARALRGAKVEGRRIEVGIRHADGTPRLLEVTVRNSLDDDAVHGIVLCGRDVTERRRAEQSLVSLALRDPLTGLPNRKQLRAQLDDELAMAARSSRPLAVLFIDLDRFKDVNDALGHHWGDALLCEVASRLKMKMRDGDLVARLGGIASEARRQRRDRRRRTNRRVARRTLPHRGPNARRRREPRNRGLLGRDRRRDAPASSRYRDVRRQAQRVQHLGVLRRRRPRGATPLEQRDCPP
jgi:PAS domain S-box-containing protein